MKKQQSASVDKNIVNLSKDRTESAKAVREFRKRLSAVGNGDTVFEHELLKGFARSHINAGYAMPLLVMIVAAYTATWTGWMVAAGWALLTIIAYLIFSFLSRRFLKKETGSDSLASWKKRFLICQILIACSWMFFASVDCSDCNHQQYAIVQFSTILVFQAATCIMSYSFGRAFLLMVAPASVLFTVRLLMTKEPTMVLMGFITITGVAFFYVMADRFRKSLITMLEHSTEKETLIAELETEKSISEAARSRAEEANLAKSRFLATMSHELRTPLNAILGFSEIMREEVMGPIDNDSYKEYVDDIHSSGSHLLKLINEILDISRIEAGKHDLNEETISLIKIVDEARHMMEIKAKQKGVNLVTNYEDNLPTIWVDERAIRQITLNLLSNALKFTPQGGRITVKVGWTAKGGQYFSVSDTGPGIPESEIPVVLSSFGQGTIAINNAEQGTGLGLTIVQALLNMHQGKFDLKSKLRIGTEAIAYLPKERVTTKQSHPSIVTPNGIVEGEEQCAVA